MQQEKEVKEEKPRQEVLSKYNEIKQNLVIMEKSLASKENKQFLKICQQIKKQQKNLKVSTLAKIIEEFQSKDKQIKLNYNEESSDPQEKHELSKQQVQKIIESKELNIYLQVLVLVHLVRNKDYTQSLNLACNIMNDLQHNNQRVLDSLNATTYFYYARVQELLQQQKISRNVLMEAYRHSCVHNDQISQATLLNLILRNYLAFNQIDLAQHFINKTNFPSSQQNYQFLRYLYYTALIKAIQLEYNDSYQRLMQVLRKAPEKGSLGFKSKVQKLAIIVEMLMGDIPSKQVFTQSDCRARLFPYYKLVQAVYKGQIQQFEAVVNQYTSTFTKDKHMNLIRRLIINVIKLGFRKINLSYSQISFADVASKLGLDDKDDVEFIIAKQIRDGVIAATVDHDRQVVVVKEQKNVYNTEQPALQFSKRIQFCLQLYQQSHQALQYPDFNQHNQAAKHFQTEEELAQELVKEMEEEGDDFDDF